MKRIKRIGVVQTAKVAAVIYFLIIAIVAIPFGLISIAFGGFYGIGHWEAILFLFIPFFYALVAFVFTVIGCWVYNLIAKRIGGIEVEIETLNEY